MTVDHDPRLEDSFTDASMQPRTEGGADSVIKELPPFLVVEDEALVMSVVRRVLAPYAEVRCASSITEALDALASNATWSGFVMDQNLGDGEGLDLLAMVRAQHPEVPALMCTGQLDMAIVNRAFDLGASYVCKPVQVERLRRFASDALGTTDDKPAPRSEMFAAVKQLARQFRLSNSESDLVEAVMARVPREQYMDEQDITDNTYKTHVRHILKKVGRRTLAEVREDVLRLVARRLRTG
jgi:DNA-binding NarL/FixJ family response regulator